MIIEKQKRMVEETKYVIELSEADRLAVIADPSGLVRDLKRAPIAADLNGGVVPESITHRRSLKTSVTKRKTPLKKNSASKREVKVKTAAPAGKFQCGKCERSFKTRGWLNQHEAKVHGVEHSGDIEIGSFGISGDD